MTPARVAARVKVGEYVASAVAAPGHDMYYLNVMDGPPHPDASAGGGRAWLITDYPDQTWIRATWADRPTDPRLPFYTAPEQEAGEPR